jgi:dienelactone hydrolase
MSEMKWTRRDMVKMGLFSAGAPTLGMGAMGAWAQGYDLGPGNYLVDVVGGGDNAQLYTGIPVEGGGQMEIRLNQSIYTDDPHEIQVAQRMEPFNPLSWYNEWKRVADINEEIAVGYEEAGLDVSARTYYARAFRFARLAIVYQEDSDATMMPGYMKMREMFEKANPVGASNFERVTINVDGTNLDGFFRKPPGPGPHPAVIAYQGADSLMHSSIGGAGGFVSRGMAYLVVDLPGQGEAKRIHHLYMQPDTERYVSDLVDYLESRPDIDSDRIAIRGISMGGYSAPRAAASEPRLKAVACASASYSVLDDLFDFYPPIRDRVRWIIGAESLESARRQLQDYNMGDVARNLECPMLVGYGATDRIMDPEGALNLYNACVNSPRQMWADAGHPHHDEKSGGPVDLRLPTLQDWMGRALGAI